MNRTPTKPDICCPEDCDISLFGCYFNLSVVLAGDLAKKKHSPCLEEILAVCFADDAMRVQGLSMRLSVRQSVSRLICTPPLCRRHSSPLSCVFNACCTCCRPLSTPCTQGHHLDVLKALVTPLVSSAHAPSVGLLLGEIQLSSPSPPRTAENKFY